MPNNLMVNTEDCLISVDIAMGHSRTLIFLHHKDGAITTEFGPVRPGDIYYRVINDELPFRVNDTAYVAHTIVNTKAYKFFKRFGNDYHYSEVIPAEPPKKPTTLELEIEALNTMGYR